ncbi:MAG: hypothetical protein L3J41_10235 [Melioribacteraceae bacterium]|nr:hypothetical protein [Melioribacteraceae bacterium]
MKYSVVVDTVEVLSPSQISMTIDDNKVLGQNAVVLDVERNSVQQKIKPVVAENFFSHNERTYRKIKFDTVGSIAGIHEVLRRQGFFEEINTIGTQEVLSSGQSEEIDRIYSIYPELNDDAFVAENLERWLS